MIAPRTLPFAVHAYDAMLLLHVFFFSCTRDYGQKEGHTGGIFTAYFGRHLFCIRRGACSLTRQATRQFLLLAMHFFAILEGHYQITPFYMARNGTMETYGIIS